jgi:TM2 domain-containing membrane protein YozV
MTQPPEEPTRFLPPEPGTPAYPAYPAYPSGYQVPPGYSAPPGYPQVDAYGRPLSDKSKVVAGVLGITLGGLGVGRFYTGHVGLGVLQLVVSLVTCGLGHFWGLIDGILILANGGTDSEGRILRD